MFCLLPMAPWWIWSVLIHVECYYYCHSLMTIVHKYLIVYKVSFVCLLYFLHPLDRPHDLTKFFCSFLSSTTTLIFSSSIRFYYQLCCPRTYLRPTLIFPLDGLIHSNTISLQVCLSQEIIILLFFQPCLHLSPLAIMAYKIITPPQIHNDRHRTQYLISPPTSDFGLDYLKYGSTDGLSSYFSYLSGSSSPLQVCTTILVRPSLKRCQHALESNL